MSYIVVKVPSINMHYNWSMKDSLDGVLYEKFSDALDNSKKLDGAGVAEVGYYVSMWELEKNAEISNDSKN